MCFPSRSNTAAITRDRTVAQFQVDGNEAFQAAVVKQQVDAFCHATKLKPAPTEIAPALLRVNLAIKVALKRIF
jgi:hypothetical protein